MPNAPLDRVVKLDSIWCELMETPGSNEVQLLGMQLLFTGRIKTEVLPIFRITSKHRERLEANMQIVEKSVNVRVREVVSKVQMKVVFEN